MVLSHLHWSSVYMLADHYVLNIYNECTRYYVHEPSKKDSQGGKLYKAKRDCWNGVRSDQLVLRTVRWEAGPRERLPKALKTKLGECQPSGSSSLRSDGSRDGQAGGMTTLVVAKGA
jgi:hypothetical protein